jgi:regulatory protein
MRGDRPAREAQPAAAVDAALLEGWALSYLGRYASSADNLRRVLRRRVRRRRVDADNRSEATAAADALIEALVARYRAAALLDDAAYAAARARRESARGRSLRQIAARLTAKGVGAEDAAAAIGGLREEAAEPDLAAACAFARRRRLGPFRAGPPPDADGRRHELAAFARAGFDRRTAATVLACPNEDAVAALLAEQRL